MSETKIKVPNGMLKAVRGLYVGNESCGEAILEAALRYQKKYPPVPTVDQLDELWPGLKDVLDTRFKIQSIIAEWVRSMYDAREPEVPEVIKDLLLPDIESGFFKPEVLNERIKTAYARGREFVGE